MLKIRQRLEDGYTAALGHRSLNNAIAACIMMSSIAYVLWESFKEHLFAWMRWHLGGYPW